MYYYDCRMTPTHRAMSLLCITDHFTHCWVLKSPEALLKSLRMIVVRYRSYTYNNLFTTKIRALLLCSLFWTEEAEKNTVIFTLIHLIIKQQSNHLSKRYVSSWIAQRNGCKPGYLLKFMKMSIWIIVNMKPVVCLEADRSRQATKLQSI